MKPFAFLAAFAAGFLTYTSQAAHLLVEAETFESYGGWVVDTQFIDIMGSPYLAAHGLGRPVKDATTKVKFPSTGKYRVWVRTKDWVAKWKAPGQPGKFELSVNDQPLATATWNGKTWEEVAGVPPEERGIEGVSGATMTSMAMAEGIMRRLAAANAAMAIPPPALQPRLRDWGLVAVLAMAMWLAFAGTHGRKWVRRSFQIFVIVYIGFLTGDLLAQSLFAGWAQSGAPWRTAPGLVLLLAAALAIPWTAGKPLYCHHLCPHGAAQELLSQISPKRWRVQLHPGVAAGLRWLPPLLLGCVLLITILVLPLDLAHIEPFDAYVLRTAGWATLTIAITSLVVSLFVPMAYCHYGCPTGALLAFVRTRGRADRFGRRDVAALALLAFGALLVWKYYGIRASMLAD